MSGAHENQVKWGLRRSKKDEGSNNNQHCAVHAALTKAKSHDQAQIDG